MYTEYLLCSGHIWHTLGIRVDETHHEGMSRIVTGMLLVLDRPGFESQLWPCIVLAKKFVFFSHNILQRIPNELSGQPNNFHNFQTSVSPGEVIKSWPCCSFPSFLPQPHSDQETMALDTLVLLTALWKGNVGQRISAERMPQWCVLH